MANVNVVATELAPIGGSTNSGLKIGFVDSKAKAAQKDTWTVTNAKSIVACHIHNDASGTVDSAYPAGTAGVIVLNGTTTGASSGIIVYAGK